MTDEWYAAVCAERLKSRPEREFCDRYSRQFSGLEYMQRVALVPTAACDNGWGVIKLLSLAGAAAEALNATSWERGQCDNDSVVRFFPGHGTFKGTVTGFRWEDRNGV